MVDGWGHGCLDVPGMGNVNIVDLGNRKLAAYTNPKIPWTEKSLGGLIRYRNLDAYFRYEGKGTVSVTIDQNGSIELSFGQGGMMINLDDLAVA